MTARVLQARLGFETFFHKHTMNLRIAASVEDFRDLREQGFQFVDKTYFITELIDLRAYKVILLPRPRRFGKSINLSMLKWFFEKSDEHL